MSLKRLLILAILLISFGCSEVEQQKKSMELYVWQGAPAGGVNPEALDAQMAKFKERGVTGLFYNLGFNLKGLELAAKSAKAAGMEFHAWIPTLLQAKNDEIQEDWYIVSREGKSCLDKPAFVGYYTFLCANKEEVFEYLKRRYLEVANIEELDGIHLDYIRYPDVILAKGLWAKYGLEMTEEFAPYDYCYCDKCVSDFKAATGIDIRELGDDAQHNEEWKEFRYSIITKFVNRLSAEVHALGKKMSAAVFPGPSMSKAMVRQEWDNWDLDIVAPMLYNDFYLETPEWVGEMTKEGIDSLKNKNVKYISGLFICPEPERRNEIKDPEGHGLLPSEIKSAVSSALESGASGISLFTFDRMTDAHWAALDSLRY